MLCVVSSRLDLAFYFAEVTKDLKVKQICVLMQSAVAEAAAAADWRPPSLHFQFQ